MVGSEIIQNAVAQKRTALTEYEAKEFLETLGLPVTKQALADTKDAAVIAAKKIGFPIVMKLMAEDIVHKSDVGAVKLDIKSEPEVVATFEELMKIPSNSKKQVSIQEMASKPIAELIVGTLQDPQFGPAIMFGIGGILVEIMKDVSFRICPITEFDADEMIHEIKAFKLLDGFRGSPKADLNALVSLLKTVSEISMDNLDVDQMDLNPVFIYENGIKIVDARIILRTTN
ncbi:MAG: acetyl-CoA synthetase [Promethearchaeota archaeon]|nr:MAG: acetyl-CoA synthetase [Candidatus Lokiarchaeota archaeon]